MSNKEATGKWIAWSKQPAIAWEDAFVTGNGHHGTMMTGSAASEKLICVHEDLYLRAWDRRIQDVANIAHLLPRVRSLVDSGKLAEAAQMAAGEARTQLTKIGAPLSESVSPHPAFDLKFPIKHSGTISDYRRQLNMETGEVMTRWKDDDGIVETAVFSSRIHNVNVLRIRGIGSRKLSITFSLEETPGRTGKLFGQDLSKAFRSVKSSADVNGYLRYHAQYAADSGGYEGLARVVAKGGRLKVVDNRLEINDAQEINVILRITPLSFGATTEEVSVRNELSQLPAAYDQLLQPHAQKHGEMFRRVTLDLGCAKQWAAIPTETMLADAHQNGATPYFLEQMHAMGRYLLISSSGKNPPPLQGIWGGGWKPVWYGGFVFDSNVNLAISAMSTGDLPECAESYFGYVERLLPAWRLNAMNYLSCRGFLVPHYSDPENGFLNHFLSSYPWMYWPSGAGWNLMPFYEHGMLTGDSNFLRKRVLPLYLEMAQFYEDYLTKEKDGYYHISPGISPENFVAGSKSILAKDCTIDIAVAREVFEHLLNLGKMFGLDKQDMDKWKQYHDHILPYRINDDGALAEWAVANYPDNYAHRHSSHLYPVFPGTEFLQQNSNPQLLKAARVAIAKRFKYDTESAHGLIHIGMMAARLHDSQIPATNLNRFAQRNYVYSGLVTSHNPKHDIYNLDAVLSLQRLLSEMLVFSQPGRIEFLPACPNDFPAGQLSGLRIHGGHKMDIFWSEGQLKSVTIYAGKNDKCEFVYGNKTKTIRLVAGARYVLDKQLNLMSTI